MRHIAILVVLGFAILGVAATSAEAAPTGTCGAGGGIWSSVDVLCARNGSVCIVWQPNARPGILCP